MSVRSISRMKSSSKCISSWAKPVIRAWMSTKSSVDITDSSKMKLSWLMLSRAIDTSTGNGKKGYKFYSPAEKKVIMKSDHGVSSDVDNVGLVGCSSEGWLVMHNKRNHELFLYNPISARRIELPSIGSVPYKVIISSDMAMAIMCVKETLSFCVTGRSALWADLNLNNDTPYKDIDFVYSSKHKLLFFGDTNSSLTSITPASFMGMFF